MKDHTYYMEKALVLARKAFELGEVPVGAVIVRDGEIVGEGYNLREREGSVIAHAEVIAIEQACKRLGTWRLSGCTLYVTMEPCPMCAGAIAWSQLGRLVYGVADEKRGYNRYAPDVLHPKTEVTQGVCADESAELMKRFFNNKR